MGEGAPRPGTAFTPPPRPLIAYVCVYGHFNQDHKSNFVLFVLTSPISQISFNKTF